jgi:protein-L-isoaspartate(D-aspartate) O-methyltransferase
MADFELQRKNMVESQIRPSDITDRRIIHAMLDLPRELFCPQAMKATAYRDEMLQVNGAKGPRARFAVAPRTLAKLIQALDLGDQDAILEIGTGTGYGAAVLSRIAASVVAVEADAALAATARANLAAVGANNVTVIEADLAAGHAAGAPYDAILLGGAIPEVPRAILDQLKDGGRLAAVVAGRGFGQLTQWRRLGGTFDSRVLSDAGSPPLAGFEKPAAFVF